MAKTGISTSTVIHKSSLSKSNGKYKLDKSEKKSNSSRNKRLKEIKKYKAKCLNCRYLKETLFCLRLEKEIESFENLTECKYFSKI